MRPEGPLVKEYESFGLGDWNGVEYESFGLGTGFRNSDSVCKVCEDRSSAKHLEYE